MWNYVKHILRHLKGKQYPSLTFYPSKSKLLSAYSDSDHVGDPDCRKSLSGSIILLGGNPIDYQCHFQKIVSHSSCESELVAFDSCARKVRELIWLVEDMGAPDQGTVPIYIDCQSALDLIRNPVQAGRNGHMHARYFYCRDLKEQKVIDPIKVSTFHQLADLLVTYKTPLNFHTLTRRLKMGILLPGEEPY